MPKVTQHWMDDLPLMQQTVLLSAIRGCDGVPKRHKIKPLIRWYRRCILLAAFEGRTLTDPFEPGGGSFSGPISDIEIAQIASEHREEYRQEVIKQTVNDFLDSRDELPYHYQVHIMHAAQILGYKHPHQWTRNFWRNVYERMVNALHLYPETEEQMDARLGDNYAGWAARSDESASCSD